MIESYSRQGQSRFDEDRRCVFGIGVDANKTAKFEGCGILDIHVQTFRVVRLFKHLEVFVYDFSLVEFGLRRTMHDHPAGNESNVFGRTDRDFTVQ